VIIDLSNSKKDYKTDKKKEQNVFYCPVNEGNKTKFKIWYRNLKNFKQKTCWI
jgi:predicted ATPase